LLLLIRDLRAQHLLKRFRVMFFFAVSRMCCVVLCCSRVFVCLQGKALAAGFANSQPLAASGVKLANTKYMFLRCDGRTLQGKKGTAGIHCVKTGKVRLLSA
jgi:hypothetical protein